MLSIIILIASINSIRQELRFVKALETTLCRKIWKVKVIE